MSFFLVSLLLFNLCILVSPSVNTESSTFLHLHSLRGGEYPTHADDSKVYISSPDFFPELQTHIYLSPLLYQIAIFKCTVLAGHSGSHL